jgi:hypothetical protein
MTTPGLLPMRALVLGLLIGSHFATSGCTDDSRTTGTVVQVTEQQKAQVKSISATYKARRQKNAAKVADKGAKKPVATPPQ